MKKAHYFDLADGISRGHSLVNIAGVIGVDRSTLRQRLTSDTVLADAARAIGSPDRLGDALEMLLDADKLPHERPEAHALRQRFAEIVRTVHRAYFRKAERDAERQRKADERKRAAASREAEKECQRKREADARRTECLRADFWNLKTLVEMRKRDWADGTPGELKRGLLTADDRRQYRCAKGLRWTCAGFGVYYSPFWSACRCRMKYASDDAGGGMDGFKAVANDPAFDQAFKEIEDESEHDYSDYSANPFARRDKSMPVTVEAAQALFDAIEKGGETKPNK